MPFFPTLFVSFRHINRGYSGAFDAFGLSRAYWGIEFTYIYRCIKYIIFRKNVNIFRCLLVSELLIGCRISIHHSSSQ